MILFKLKIDKTYKLYHKQLAAKIKELIERGDIPENFILPSLRKFAKAVGVSKNTILLAYEQLISENYALKSNNKYITTARTKQVDWMHLLHTSSHFITGKSIFYLSKSEPAQPIIALIHKEFGFPEIYVKTLDKISEQIENMPLDYDKAGFIETRRTICNYLQQREIYCKPSQIILTSSERAAMYLIFMTIKDGINVLAHEPCRLSLQKTSLMANQIINYLKTDKFGIVPEDIYLKAMPPNESVLYFESLCEWPMGVFVPEVRFDEISEICKNKDIPVIEIDLRREQYFGIEQRMPLKSKDTAGNIIYITGFMTDANPMDSLCCIVAPDYFAESLLVTYNQTNFSVYQMPQLVLSHMLENGEYIKFTNNFRHLLQKRHQYVQKLLTKYLEKYATWTKPISGLIVFITFIYPISVNMMNLPKDICTFLYGSCFGQKYKNSLAIWVTSNTENKIEYFIKILEYESAKQNFKLF